MDWKNLSPAKKGLLIGVFAGSLFGIYSNITDCHTGLGGPSGICNNPIELSIAVFEFILWIGPVILLSWIPSFLDSTIGFRIILLISPILILGLIGLFIGWMIGKAKSKQ